MGQRVPTIFQVDFHFVASCIVWYCACACFGVVGRNGSRGFVSQSRKETAGVGIIVVVVVVHKIVRVLVVFCLAGQQIHANVNVIVVIDYVFRLWILNGLAGVFGYNGSSTEKVPIRIGMHGNQDGRSPDSLGRWCGGFREKKIKAIAAVAVVATVVARSYTNLVLKVFQQIALVNIVVVVAAAALLWGKGIEL